MERYKSDYERYQEQERSKNFAIAMVVAAILIPVLIVVVRTIIKL